jgi:prophage regulatory protein
VIQRVGFGKTKIYDLIKKGQFPAQAAMLNGSRTAGWYEDEIDLYVESGRNDRPDEWKQFIGTAKQFRLPDVAQEWDTPTKKEVKKPSHNRAIKTNLQPQDQCLVVTGMQILGCQIYLHQATGKLLLDFGRAPAIFLAQLAACRASDQPALGAE